MRLKDMGRNTATAPATLPDNQQGAETPDERIASAINEIRDSVANELLDKILNASAEFFERLVLDLLFKMGYGSSLENVQHTGQTNDEGIDGIIALDRLGLERVVVQAKRWQRGSSVGRPVVQAFYGAYALKGIKKGVFITTARFTRDARELERSSEGLVLIDGQQLAELLIEYEIGVSNRFIKVPKIDLDYFEE